MGLYDQIKDLIPTIAATGVGAAFGGAPGAMLTAGAGAQNLEQEQQANSQNVEKLASLMSLMEERKAREAYQQASLDERRDIQQQGIDTRRDLGQQSIDARVDQNKMLDSIRSAQEIERAAHDREMESLTKEGIEGRHELGQEMVEIKAMTAGKEASGPARFDASVNSLSMMSGHDPGEVGEALSKAGISPTGASYVSMRYAEQLRQGKKPDLDTVIGMASKVKTQYGGILNNLDSAIADPKAKAAALTGPDAYANYLVAKSRIQGLPPAERKNAESRIRAFAKASVGPKFDPMSELPLADDTLSKLIDPAAPLPEESAATPAAKATPSAARGAAAPSATPAARPAAKASPTAKAEPATGGRAVGAATKQPDGVYRVEGRVFTVKGGKIVKVEGGPSGAAASGGL